MHDTIKRTIAAGTCRDPRRVSGQKEEKLGAFSLMHWLVVLLVILIVLGVGRFPRLMRDLGEGIRTFRANLDDRGEAGILTTARTEDPARADGR
jgi:TatA/E family protein of Tat protein translocase